MADNVTLPASGSGDVLPQFATEAIGSPEIHYQIVKLAGGRDDATRVARIDPSTNSLQVIEYEHHEVHDGNMFRVGYNVDSVDDNGTMSICFKTPTGTNETHMLIQVRSDKEVQYGLFEGATWITSTGTAVVPYDQNRVTANTSVCLGDASGSFVAGVMNANPDGLTGGTNVHPDHMGSAQKSGGDTRGDEIVLANNTQYAVMVTAEAAASDVTINLLYYHHTPITAA